MNRFTHMRMRFSAMFITGALACAATQAVGGTDAKGAEDAISPYQGQEHRSIKALSAGEIDDYLNGRGLGYAKAAELNHYPGPRHVLDLAEELELTPEQTRHTEAVFDTMQSAAAALGKRLVALESRLDGEFATQSADDESLRALLHEIGAVEAELRFIHLSAHLKQKALLTMHQVHRYDQLRGYGGDGSTGHTHQH